MTVERKKEILASIDSLNRKLQEWQAREMLDAVRDIGAQAILDKLTLVSKPLKDEEIFFAAEITV